MNLSPEQASGMLQEWMNAGQQVGVIYFGKFNTLITVAHLADVSTRRVRFVADATSATFAIKNATFTFEPMEIWPRWPYPPTAKVNGIKVQLEDSDSLFISAAPEVIGYAKVHPKQIAQ